MRLLGFKYKPRQKCYNVDGHKTETKAYRKKFARCYFEYEKLMHHWIQIELTHKLTLEEQEVIKLAHGRHYIDPKMLLVMVKFHIDDHHLFQDTPNGSMTYGVSLSIKFPECKKPHFFWAK
jgi:hypothetical protein